MSVTSLAAKPVDGQLTLAQEQPRDDSAAWIAMIERLATNPDVNVDVIERMLAMRERVMARNAEAEFNAAFAEMQPEIPVITESHEGDAGKWTFAPLEDIVEPLRPILAKYGFALSHKSEWPDGKTVKVIGILKHRSGHAEKSEFMSGADNSGSKNAIQGLGSAVAYGKRYTTKDLLCIVTRREDDDGAKSERGKHAEAPDGYDAWLANLEGVAVDGMAKFAPAWNNSKPEFRSYLSKTEPKTLAKLKTMAAKAGKHA